MPGDNPLLDLLSGITPPDREGYRTAVVPGSAGYRIGRGLGGSIVLLTPPDPDPDPPTRLRRIRLDPRIRCRIESADGTSEHADHGVIEVEHLADEEVPAFVALASALVALVGDTPSAGAVSRSMRRLVRLFEPGRQPRGGVVGLWGELLVVSMSRDPGRLVDAWHASIDDRFDFAEPGSRLEVKTTTRRERLHRFNLAQLRPVAATTVHLASVMTTETSAGVSVADLISDLEGSGLSADRQMKVHEQVAATLGEDWLAETGRRFDANEATSSLRVLDASVIPRVTDPPAAVRDVTLLVDCTAVPESVTREGLADLLPAT